MQQLLPGIDHRGLLEELCAELASDDPPPAWEALARLRSIARQLTEEQWDLVASCSPYGTVRRWALDRGDSKPTELRKVQEAHRRVRRGLPVVSERSPTQQHCEMCAIAVKCYDPAASAQHVRLNVLACRIQRDIGREQATRLLLEQLRPKLVLLAGRLRRQTGMARQDALAEVQSVTIEGILGRYDLGEVAYLAHWLFHPLRGWVSAHVNTLTQREATRRAREAPGVEGVAGVLPEDDLTTDRTERARAIVADGMGLTEEERSILVAVLEGVGAEERRGDVLARWARERGRSKKDAADLWRRAQERLRRLV